MLQTVITGKGQRIGVCGEFSPKCLYHTSSLQDSGSTREGVGRV